MENEVKKNNLSVIIVLTTVICLIIFVPIGIFLGLKINSNRNNEGINSENITNVVSNDTIRDEDKIFANDILEEFHLSYIIAFVMDNEPGFGNNIFNVKLNETLLTELNIGEEFIKSTTYEGVQSSAYVEYDVFTNTYHKLFNKQYQYIKDEKVYMGGFGFESDEGHNIDCSNNAEEPCYVGWNSTWSDTPYRYGLVPLSIENNIIKGNIVKNKEVDVFKYVVDEDAVEGSFEFVYGINEANEYYIKSLILYK